MELRDSLDLWLKYRNATEQRNYWFLLAQATAITIVVANLKDLTEMDDRQLSVFAVCGLGVASAIVTVASILAYRWDWERLASVSALIDSERRPVFTAGWDKSALYGPFAFAVFYFAVATWIALKAASPAGLLALVGLAIAATFVISVVLTKDVRLFLQKRKAIPAAGTPPNDRSAAERPAHSTARAKMEPFTRRSVQAAG